MIGKFIYLIYASFLLQKQLADQADLVKRYMEHKQLTRQMAANQEKSKLDAKALQAATDRVMAARLRVASIKARKSTLKVRKETATL